jgi:hypothetical protein
LFTDFKQKFILFDDIFQHNGGCKKSSKQTDV